MYQDFFHLARNSFSSVPDSSLLYRTPLIDRTLQALEQALRQGDGIGLLTAQAGVGKTLVCKVIRDRLASRCSICADDRNCHQNWGNGAEDASRDDGPVPVLLLQSQFPTRSSLLQAILFELGRPYARMTEQELRLELISYGREIAPRHQGIAVIVDEAHLLGEHILEELRGLTNYMFCAEPIFRVVLSGHLALEETLTSRSLEAVNQRLSCHVTLETLTKQESVGYIEARIQGTGASCSDLFTRDALDLIVHASDGLPRCLNQLCDHTCMLAYLEGTKPAEESHVREALADLVKLPLHWNIPQPRLDPLSELNGSAISCESSEVESGNACEADESVVEFVSGVQQGGEGERTPESDQHDTMVANTMVASEASESAAVFEVGGPACAESESATVHSASESAGSGELRSDYDSLQEGFDKVAFEQRFGEEADDGTSPNQLEGEISFEVDEESCEDRAPDRDIEKGSENGMIEIETDSITPAQRQELAESLLRGLGETERDDSRTVEETCEEEEPSEEAESGCEEAREETVQDRYAELDARRLGQLSDMTSLEAVSSQQASSSSESDMERSIEKSVLELTAELSTAIGDEQEDIVPNPEDVIVTACETYVEAETGYDETGYDIVEPEDS